MEKATLECCKLKDLRRIFSGVKSSKKILVNGMNDIIVKFHDDGIIEFLAVENESQEEETVKVEKKPVNESLKETAHDPLSGIEKPSDMFIDALSARKARIIEKLGCSESDSSAMKDSLAQKLLTRNMDDFCFPDYTISAIARSVSHFRSTLIDMNATVLLSRFDTIVRAMLMRFGADKLKEFEHVIKNEAMNLENTDPIISYSPSNMYPWMIAPSKSEMFYDDIMFNIRRYGFDIYTAAYILVNKKKWRKALTKALKRRKKIGKFKKSTKGMSTPIDLSKLVPKNPELPSKKEICFIKIPYRGYLVPEDFPQSEIIDYQKRKTFGNACKRYYEESGCEVFETVICDDYVTITMIKRKNKIPTKSVLEYME